MPSINDPADTLANLSSKSKINQLLEILNTPGWEHASNMKSGEPYLLAHEILRLSDFIYKCWHEGYSSDELMAEAKIAEPRVHILDGRRTF